MNLTQVETYCNSEFKQLQQVNVNKVVFITVIEK